MIQWNVEERRVDATKVFVAFLQTTAFSQILYCSLLGTAVIERVSLSHIIPTV